MAPASTLGVMDEIRSMSREDIDGAVVKRVLVAYESPQESPGVLTCNSANTANGAGARDAAS